MLRKLGQGGIAATEFALVAPVLLLLLLGAFDVANLVQTSMRLERATRAGAQLAAADASNMAAIQAQVIAAWPELTVSDVPLPTLTCECASVVAACTAACAGEFVQVVTITAQRNLTPQILQTMTPGRGSAVVRLR